jgi:AraC family transcriptional regulator
MMGRKVAMDEDQPPVPQTGRRSLLSSASLGWTGLGAELLAINAGHHVVPGLAVHRVSMHMGQPVKAVCRCDGPFAMRIQSDGDIDVIPAGLHGEWSDDADCTLLNIWFSEDFLRTTHEQMDAPASRAQIRPSLQWRDARFQFLSRALHAELEAHSASDALYAESLGTAMLVRLLGADVPYVRYRRTLSTRSAARVIDYIEGRLDQRLSLSELAALVDLSVPHFNQLFRETMGVPVHRYVVLRRLEKAKGLLLQGKLSVGQVALDVGFSHQSHLASWMKRVFGVTPRELANKT